MVNVYFGILKIQASFYELKSKYFLASNLSTCDVSTVYTALSYNLIKEKLTKLIEQTFTR